MERIAFLSLDAVALQIACLNRFAQIHFRGELLVTARL